jgi:hypothetical protein
MSAVDNCKQKIKNFLILYCSFLNFNYFNITYKLTVMKKILLPCSFLILIFLLHSCLKHDSLTDNKFDAAAAKEWYYGVFKKSEEYKTDLSVSGIKKYPDWKHGISQTKDGYQIVEFPLNSTLRTVPVISNTAYSEADKRRIVDASLERIVMIKDPAGRITPRIVTYIPDLDYLAKHNYDISENKVTGIDNDFNGFLFIRSWNGSFINGFKIAGGRITRKMATETRTTNKLARIEGECSWTYNDNYSLYFGGHMEGDGVVWDYMTVTYTGTSDWVFQGCTDGLNIGANFNPCSYGVCGGSGSGGTGSGEPATPVQSVTDNLNDPCKNAALSTITDANLQNFVTKFYNNYLVPTDSKFNLVINEAPDITVNGLPVPAYTTSLGNNTWQITISSTYYSSANGYNMSQQAWADVIAHEIIHVAILANNINPGGNDHALMFKNFIDPLKNLLEDAYGMSETDALGLALSGINDLWGYSDFDQLMYETYGMHTTDVQAVLDSYTKGSGGTKC